VLVVSLILRVKTHSVVDNLQIDSPAQPTQGDPYRLGGRVLNRIRESLSSYLVDEKLEFCRALQSGIQVRNEDDSRFIVEMGNK